MIPESLMEAQILGINTAEIAGVGFVSGMWGFMVSLFGELLGASAFFITNFFPATGVLFAISISAMLLHRNTFL